MLSFLMAAALAAPPQSPERGVSQALALARASVIGDVRYDVTFRVPADRSRPVDVPDFTRGKWKTTPPIKLMGV